MLYIINCSNGILYSSYQCSGLIKTIPCIHSSSDIVYLGAHDQFIHAIHIQSVTSKCIWKYGLNSSCVSSPQLSIDNTRLYVASLGGDVFAFQSDDGTLLWKQSFNKPIFSTIAIWKEKFLMIGCVDQKLYCLNCENGQEVRVFI
jgi:outer membrane protein assembly factor BamB